MSFKGNKGYGKYTVIYNEFSCSDDIRLPPDTNSGLTEVR